MRKTAAFVGISVSLAVASGCAATATPAPTVTVTVEAPTPSAPPVVTRNTESSLDLLDAYLACKYVSSQFLFTRDDFRLVTFDRFEESVVHLRADGLYYVYIEYENPTYEVGYTDYYAANCIVGGTLGDQRYEMYGNTERLTPDEIAAAAEAPLATE